MLPSKRTWLFLAILAVLSLFVLLGRHWLFADTYEPFSGAATLGQVLADFSAAYLASLVFFALVVYMPARATRAANLADQVFLEIVRDAEEICEALVPDGDPRALSRDELERRISQAASNGPSSLVLSTNPPRNATWVEYLRGRAARVREGVGRVLPFAQFTTADRVQRLLSLDRSTYLRRIEFLTVRDLMEGSLAPIARELSGYLVEGLRLVKGTPPAPLSSTRADGGSNSIDLAQVDAVLARGPEVLQERRTAWQGVADAVIVRTAKTVIDQLPRVNAWRGVYVARKKRWTNFETVQFWFGAAPSGVYSPNALGVERGAALVFSIAEDGRVATLAYPFFTELPDDSGRKGPGPAFGPFFDSAELLTADRVGEIIRSFLAWASRTSIYGPMTDLVLPSTIVWSARLDVAQSLGEEVLRSVMEAVEEATRTKKHAQ
jgi:hypothetical protein